MASWRAEVERTKAEHANARARGKRRAAALAGPVVAELPLVAPRIAAEVPQPAPQSRAAGRRARTAGQQAEAQVLSACEAYRRSGRAVLVKHATPTKLISTLPGGRFIGCFDGKAPVDFSGTLPGGRSVYLEVKASSVPRLRLEHRGEARLGDEQAERLAQLASMGAVACVLVVVATRATRLNPGPPHRWFLFRWQDWQRAERAAEAAGRASISLEQLETHGRECALVCGWPDWLAALEV